MLASAFIFFLVAASSVRAGSDYPPLLTLKKVNTISEINDDNISCEFSISSETSITGITSLVLDLREGLPELGNETTYLNFDVTDISMEVTAQYNISRYEFEHVTTIIMVAHNGLIPLAVLTQGFTTQDISPSLTWVGDHSLPPDERILRIATPIDIWINDTTKCEVDSSPCYYFDYTLTESLELCTTAVDEEELPLDDILQCDSTLSVQESQDLTSLKRVELIYPVGDDVHPTMIINADFNETSLSLDGLFYDAESQFASKSCDIQSEVEVKTCTFDDIHFDDIHFDGTHFNVLMVGVGLEEEVTESTAIGFEDYKTEVQILTGNIIEVRWNAMNEDLHKIYLNPPVQEYKEVKLSCGGERDQYCKSYFVGLQDQQYTASVRKDSDDPGAKNIVSAKVDMTTAGGVENMIVTKLTAKNDGQHTLTLKSVDKDINNVNKIVLAILNSDESSDTASEIIYINEKEKAIAITNKEIDFDFMIDTGRLLTDESVYMIVTAHGNIDDDNAMGIAMIETSYAEMIYPSVNEVGNSSTKYIRIQTGDMALDINGIPYTANELSILPPDETFQTPILLCREAGQNLDGSPMNQCDLTQQLGRLHEIEMIKSMQLDYPDDLEGLPTMTMTAEYNETSSSLQGIFFDEETSITSDCTIEREGITNSLGFCAFQELSLTGYTFSILVVALGDNEEVIESTMLYFEDYKTEVQALTNNIMEVRWVASTEDDHRIYLNSTSEDTYTEILLNCGGSRNSYCKAYFVGHQDPVYLASVRKNDPEPGDKNIVGAYIHMGLEEPVTLLKITRFTENVDESFTATIASAGEDIKDVFHIVLAFISSKGPTEIAQEFIYIQYTNATTISKEELDIDFDIDRKYLMTEDSLQLIVTAHGGGSEEALGVAMIETSFKEMIYPTVDEVGSQDSPWIRIQTGDMALEVNGNQYESNSIDYAIKEDEFEDSLLICREAGTNLDGTTMKQCDLTQSLIRSPDITSISSVQLTYPADKGVPSMLITAEYIQESIFLEGIFIEGEQVLTSKSCELMAETDNEAKDCTFKEPIEENDDFEILLIALDLEGHVRESSSVNFQNYYTEIQALTNDSIEIRWRSQIDQQFEIYLEDLVEHLADESTSISFNCGGHSYDDCKSYFVDLQEEDSYTAGVKVTTTAGYDNIVSATIDLPSTESLPTLAITNLKQLNENLYNVTLKSSISPVENVKQLFLAIINTDDNSELLQLIAEDVTIDVTGTDYSFDVDTSSIEPDANVYLIVTAHGEGDEDPAMAVAEVKPSLGDITPPAVNEIGNSDLLWLRVKTQEGPELDINGHICLPNEVTYFPKGEDFPSPMLICWNAGTNLDGSPMEQCNPNQKLDTLVEIQKVNSVQLTYPPDSEVDLSMSIKAEYLADSISLEGVFIEGEAYSSKETCEITEDTDESKNCEFTDNIPEEDTYRVLLVALNSDGTVIESTSVSLQNYYTGIQALTNDSIEVRWNSNSAQPFDIYVEEPADLPYSKITFECGEDANENCKAYFVDLKPEGSYTASVKVKPSPDVYDNIVRSTINMPSTNPLPTLAIKDLKQLDEEHLYNITLKASESSVENVKKLVLAIIKIDEGDKISEFIEIIEEDLVITQQETDYTFNIDLDLFSLESNFYIMITAHGDGDNDPAMAVAKINPSFMDIENPAVDEVGSSDLLWLRIKTPEGMALDINGHHYEADTTTYAPKEDDFQSPMLICRTAGTNIDGSPMEQCTDNQEIQSLVELETVNSILLAYPEISTEENPFLRINAGYRDTSTSLEGYFYDHDNTTKQIFECALTEAEDATKNCTFRDFTFTQDLTEFNMVMVGLDDNGIVTESSARMDFEDYKPDAKFILEELLQISWDTKSKAQFTIYLDKEVPDGMSLYTSECGPDPTETCMIYFTDLTDTNYVVSVRKKRSGGELNIVSIEVEYDLSS